MNWKRDIIRTCLAVSCVWLALVALDFAGTSSSPKMPGKSKFVLVKLQNKHQKNLDRSFTRAEFEKEVGRDITKKQSIFGMLFVWFVVLLLVGFLIHRIIKRRLDVKTDKSD